MIFGKLGRHSVDPFTSTPPLQFSVFLNPAKDQAFAALPTVVALGHVQALKSTYIQSFESFLMCEKMTSPDESRDVIGKSQDPTEYLLLLFPSKFSDLPLSLD